MNSLEQRARLVEYGSKLGLYVDWDDGEFRVYRGNELVFNSFAPETTEIFLRCYGRVFCQAGRRKQ